MKKIFRSFAVARSGSHAIYNWMTQQFPSEKDKYVRGYKYFNIISDQKDSDVVIDNYEDVSVKDIPSCFKIVFKAKNKKRSRIEIPFLEEREEIVVVVLRDPFNLFASRSRQRPIRAYSSESTMQIKEIWKDHAREILGDTNYYKNKIGLLYNRWHSSTKYRRKISEKMGGSFSDEGINKMTYQGRGSSFNRKNEYFKNNAREMDVENRWKIFLSNDKYDQYKKRILPIFKDKELISLSERIFGHIDGTEVLYE